MIELPNTVDYPPLFAGRYEDYAAAGVVAGADNSGGDESINRGGY